MLVGLLAAPGVLGARPGDDVAQALARLVVERVEEDVDVDGRAGLVGVDLTPSSISSALFGPGASEM